MGGPGDRRGGRVIVAAAAVVVVTAMVAPILVVIPVSLSSSRFVLFPPPELSLRWYIAFFTDGAWLRASAVSVAVALMTTATTLALGVPAAFGLVRGRFFGRSLVAILLISPMMAPVIQLAIALYWLLIELGMLGTLAGIVIAHSVFTLPFVVVVVAASLRRLDRSYELVAISLGASPFAAICYITLPLIGPGLLIAGLLAFVASFNEFLVARFVTGATTATLPMLLWKGMRFETNPTIAAVATMFAGLSIATLVWVEVGRRRGRRR